MRNAITRIWTKAMTELTGKTVVLGVTGGIAVYKAADLVRRGRRQVSAIRAWQSP